MVSRTRSPTLSECAAVAPPARMIQPASSRPSAAARQPRRRHQRARRIAEDRRGRADLDRPPVDFHHEAEVGEVLIGARPVADHEPGRRGIVGDHVRQRELEVPVARIDDLHRRRDGLDRRHRLRRASLLRSAAPSAGRRAPARCADGHSARFDSDAPSSSRIASVSRPQTTSSTLTWRILAREVRPILTPTSLSPRFRRRSIDAA